VKKQTLILVGFIIIILGAGVWFWHKHAASPKPITTPVTIPNSQTAEATVSEAPTSVVPEKVAPEKKDPPWEQLIVKKGDSLARIFSREKLPTAQLQQILRHKNGKLLNALPVGSTIHLQRSSDKRLNLMMVHLNKEKTVRVQALTSTHVDVTLSKPEYDSQMVYATGVVKDSFQASAKKAGIPSHLITQMTEILASNLDLAKDLHRNDAFHLLFEEQQLNGKKIGKENILAIEFINKGKPLQAIRYEAQKGHFGYFSPEGKGLQQAFLRTPIESARITSHFGNRKHPVLHRIRAHKGVDYAAPTGTPIKAVSDGKVVFVGSKGGYGKSVELKHNAAHSTFYAHMSKFAAQLKSGMTVTKGQVIGYVGRTGLASGPHLHYEFRVNGVHRNPLTVALPKHQTIPEPRKKDFKAHAQQMLATLNEHKTIAIARNETFTRIRQASGTVTQ